MTRGGNAAGKTSDPCACDSVLESSSLENSKAATMLFMEKIRKINRACCPDAAFTVTKLSPGKGIKCDSGEKNGVQAFLVNCSLVAIYSFLCSQTLTREGCGWGKNTVGRGASVGPSALFHTLQSHNPITNCGVPGGAVTEYLALPHRREHSWETKSRDSMGSQVPDDLKASRFRAKAQMSYTESSSKHWQEFEGERTPSSFF